MKQNRALILLPFLLVAAATAQTQLVRGKVEDVRHTQGKFILDCTKIPLQSSKFNLNLMTGQIFELTVMNRGSLASPVLEIVGKKTMAKIFDMGNLRFGRAETWQVRAESGSATLIFVNATSSASYLPLGPIGTWLLGPGAIPLVAGIVNTRGLFQFKLTMPTIPALVGVSFSGQAVVSKGNKLILSNTDCKTVRNR